MKGIIKPNTMDKKRIHNPENKKYYKIRQRITKKGKGQILGKWSPK